MIITILNGNPGSSDESFDQELTTLKKTLTEQGSQTHLFTLRDMDLRYCVGCWDCWWKTPGLCRHKDDAEQIYRWVIASDLLIFASPVIAGFVSSLVKKVNDRMIPLIHPYLKMIGKECHHRKRYDRFPSLGLILKPEADRDRGDIDVITDIYKRFAINFHSRLQFVYTTQQTREDLIHAIRSV